MSQRQLSVLKSVREKVGDTRYFKTTMEHFRQLGIWVQVRTYQKAQGIPTEDAEARIKAIENRYPELTVEIRLYEKASENLYYTSRDSGSYVDTTGREYMRWCLKSIGIRKGVEL